MNDTNNMQFYKLEDSVESLTKMEKGLEYNTLRVRYDKPESERYLIERCDNSVVIAGEGDYIAVDTSKSLSNFVVIDKDNFKKTNGNKVA